MAKKPVSDAVRKLDTRARGKFKENVQEFVNQFGGGAPPGIYRCKLSQAMLYLNRNDDPQVDFIYVVKEGEQEGQQIRDMHTIAERGKRTVDLALQIVAGRLQNLGRETGDISDARHLNEHLEALSKEAPDVELEVEDNQYRNVRNIRLLAEPSADEKEKPSPAKEKPSDDDRLRELGRKADEEDDAKSKREIEGTARLHDIDPDDYETYAEVVKLIIEKSAETAADDVPFEEGSRVVINDPNDDDCPWNGEVVSILNDNEMEIKQDETGDVWTVRTEFVASE